MVVGWHQKERSKKRCNLFAIAINVWCCIIRLQSRRHLARNLAVYVCMYYSTIILCNSGQVHGKKGKADDTNAGTNTSLSFRDGVCFAMYLGTLTKVPRAGRQSICGSVLCCYGPLWAGTYLFRPPSPSIAFASASTVLPLSFPASRAGGEIELSIDLPTASRARF